jgi:phosphatidylinositol-3-phosphatase
MVWSTSRGLGLILVLCAFALPASASAMAAPASPEAGLVTAARAASVLPPIRHVFVIIDENESDSTTFGSASPAPYLSKTLVSQGAYLPNYYAVGHNSLDNYIAMVSGQAPNPQTSGDCPTFKNFPADSMDAAGQENGQGCAYPADVPTIMSQLDAAHLTWRAYEDGMGVDPARESSTCGHPPVGAPDNTELGESAAPFDEYATRHDPFVYFHYVIDNSTECNANVVALNRLPTDLQRVATTPNYVFITPDLCNDGHDSPCKDGVGAGGLTQADQFLQTWVPKILASPAYRQDGLLIITFDESVGDDRACCGEQPGPYDAINGIQPGGGGPGGGDVGAVLLSRYIKPETVAAPSYNHYSMLGTVEDLFGLRRIADAVGATAFGSDVFTNPVTASQIKALLSRELAPSGKAAKIGALLRNHGYKLRLRALEAGRLLVRWYALGHRRSRSLIATATVRFPVAGTTTAKVRLTGAGRRLLRRSHSVKLLAQETFTAASSGASAVAASRRVKLRT